MVKLSGILIILLLVLLGNAFADKIIVPFDCYPRELRARFEERGFKLDLSAIERTRDSWAFLVSEGQQYLIYTYKPVTQEDFDVIMEVVWDELGASCD